MRILNLNIEDGIGPIQVVVEDAVDAERLLKFVKEGMAAIVEKSELEMEIAS